MSPLPNRKRHREANPAPDSRARHPLSQKYSQFSAATCYRGRQRTVGRARLALAVWTGYLCPIYSRVPSLLGQRPMRHERDQRQVSGYRTSPPRVSSDGRTRTYNLAVNSRLRCLLRHAGIMKTLCSSRSVRPEGIEPTSPA